MDNVKSNSQTIDKVGPPKITNPSFNYILIKLILLTNNVHFLQKMSNSKNPNGMSMKVKSQILLTKFNVVLEIYVRANQSKTIKIYTNVAIRIT